MGSHAEETSFESLPRQIARRHWLLFLCGQSAGILASLHCPGKGLLFAFLALLLSACIYFYPRLLSYRQALVWAFFFFAFGNMLVVLHGLPRQADQVHRLALSYPHGPLGFEGVVSETKPLCEGDSYNSFVLHIDTLIDAEGRSPLTGKALVGWSDPLHPLYHGSRIRISGRLSPHLSTMNHGVFDREEHRRSQGVFSSIRCWGTDLRLLSEPRFSLPYWTSRLRQNQADRLVRAVPSRAFSFILGVWLGDRSLIDDATYDTFALSGTAHVLAVSGLHVGIIVLTFPFLCRLLRIPKRYTILCSMAGVIVFAFMTGAHISVIRSTLMVLLYHVYQLFRREADTVSVLSFSGVIFLTAQPHVIGELAFLLSFGSVASILLFYPGITAYFKRLPRFLSSTLAVTLASQLITLPLVAWYFFNVSVTAILANLLVVPLLAPLLWLAMATGILSYVFPMMALLTGHALLPLVYCIHKINDVALRLPFAYLSTTRPTLLSLCFYGAFLLLIYLWLNDERHRRKRQLLCLLCAGATLLFWRPFFPPPQVDFLDVGRGDSTFIRTPGGTTLLIDAGDMDSYADAGKRTVLPFLRANRVPHLDYLVISHSHRDHIGGSFYLLKHFPVKTVVLGPMLTKPDPLEKELCALCEERGIPILRLARGDELPAKKARISVLHPTPDFADHTSCNNQSLVLSVEFLGLRCLFTGDIEEAAEKEVVSLLSDSYDILKIAHHGSPTSSTPLFLDAVRPAVAVASVQREGTRGSLLKPPMMERYEARGTHLLRTDWHGGVRVLWNRRKGFFDIRSAREEAGYSLEPVK